MTDECEAFSMEEKGFVLKPVANGSVSKIVMERIKEGLIKKELIPGDKLPTEAELCKGMGIGKSSVREALKMLEVMGVVESRHGDGYYISSSVPENSINPLVYQLLLDQGNNLDILELRSMFEPAYALMAMKKATDSEILNLVSICENFEKKVADGNQNADDDLRFHIAILHITDNPFVIRIGLTIMQLFHASISKSMQRIPERAVKDHRNILDAFIKKDEKKLLDAVNSSFDGWTSIMENGNNK
jgi:GntR family transcriptional repressor for pyruvate dehydrogenase complex